MSAQRRALLQSSLMAVAGLGLLKIMHQPGPATIVLAMALAVGVCGLVVPRAFLWFERGHQAAARAAAVALTWVLLTLVYVGYFVPGHIVVLLLRKDPLLRKFRTGEPTYWSSHHPAKVSEPYRRQY